MHIEHPRTSGWIRMIQNNLELDWNIKILNSECFNCNVAKTWQNISLQEKIQNYDWWNHQDFGGNPWEMKIFKFPLTVMTKKRCKVGGLTKNTVGTVFGRPLDGRKWLLVRFSGFQWLRRDKAGTLPILLVEILLVWD